MKLTVAVAEASKRTGFSQHAIRRGVKDGVIPSVQIGRLVRIPTVWLEQLGALSAGKASADAPTQSQEKRVRDD